MRNNAVLIKHLNKVANQEIMGGIAYRLQRNAMIANQFKCDTFSSSPEEIYLESERTYLIRFFFYIFLFPLVNVNIKLMIYLNN